jgi:hypothetical protein
MDQDQRPPSDPHFEEMAEKIFREGFSAEEYAARFTAGWLCLGSPNSAMLTPRLMPGCCVWRTSSVRWTEVRDWKSFGKSIVRPKSGAGSHKEWKKIFRSLW